MRFIQADTLFNGKTYLPKDSVLVLNNDNTLKEIIPENSVEKSKVEFFEGTIMPGFVNAHCHLELSHLKNQIPRDTGLLEFAKQIISKRNKFRKEEIQEAMLEADKEMRDNGIVAVGDISNGTDSFEIKSESKLFYHTFIELIGFNPADAPTIFNKGLGLLEELQKHGLAGSLAPHAPYSSSTDLIRRIADMNRPFSIHNQETEEERFLFWGNKSKSKSKFYSFYKSLGMDISWFKAPGTSSLKSYVNVLSDTAPSLLVHNIFVDGKDEEFVNCKNIFWCLCLGANLYIDHIVPDFVVVRTFGDRLCIGTDSLASNSQLNLMYEANLILKEANFISPPLVPTEYVLKALTGNGAEALDISDKFGSFIVGKNAGLNLIDIKNSKIRFIKKIV